MPEPISGPWTQSTVHLQAIISTKSISRPWSLEHGPSQDHPTVGATVHRQAGGELAGWSHLWSAGSSVSGGRGDDDQKGRCVQLGWSVLFHCWHSSSVCGEGVWTVCRGYQGIRLLQLAALAMRWYPLFRAWKLGRARTRTHALTHPPTHTCVRAQ